MPVRGTRTVVGETAPDDGWRAILYVPGTRWSANEPPTARMRTVACPGRENMTLVTTIPIGGSQGSSGKHLTLTVSPPPEGVGTVPRTFGVNVASREPARRSARAAAAVTPTRATRAG